MLMDKYNVKTSRIGYTKLYLVTDIGKVDFFDGYYAWKMSLDYYFKEALKNVKNHMKDNKMEFNKKHSDINYPSKNPFLEVE